MNFLKCITVKKGQELSYLMILKKDTIYVLGIFHGVIFVAHFTDDQSFMKV